MLEPRLLDKNCIALDLFGLRVWIWVNTALCSEERMLIAEKIFFQVVSVELPASQNVSPWRTNKAFHCF